MCIKVFDESKIPSGNAMGKYTCSVSISFGICKNYGHLTFIKMSQHQTSAFCLFSTIFSTLKCNSLFSGLVTNKSKNGCPFLLFISSSLLHVCIYFYLHVHSFSHHLHLKKDRKEDCVKVRVNKWELVQISILRMRVVTVWTS